MELEQYTKKELIGMLTASMAPLEFYSTLEVKTVMGGKPFAKPSERIATAAIRTIQQIQLEALERIKPKPTKRGADEQPKTNIEPETSGEDSGASSNPTNTKVTRKRATRVRKKK